MCRDLEEKAKQNLIMCFKNKSKGELCCREHRENSEGNAADDCKANQELDPEGPT